MVAMYSSMRPWDFRQADDIVPVRHDPPAFLRSCSACSCSPARPGHSLGAGRAVAQACGVGLLELAVGAQEVEDRSELLDGVAARLLQSFLRDRSPDLAAGTFGPRGHFDQHPTSV